MPTFDSFFVYPAASPYDWMDELFEGRQGTPFSLTNQGNLLVREYTRRFLVVVKDNRLSEVAVCNAPGLPLPFSFYQSGNGVEYDLRALCVDLSAAQDADNWDRWIVTAKYSTDIKHGFPDKPDQGKDNPELEPPELEWDFETIHVALQYDRKKQPFVNSAGVPFVPAPTFEVALPVLVMTRNELSFTAAVANDFCYAVNLDPFLSAEPGQCQCMPPKAKLKYLGQLAYWRVTYRLRFFTGLLPDGTRFSFQPNILDQGTTQLVNTPQGMVLVPIMPRGVMLHHPVLLDGHDNQQTQRDGNGNLIPNWINFQVYRTKIFAKLLVRGMN